MRTDTVIIGGGPAGAAAAIHLARQGIPVHLLERNLGPHHKVCGEFISYEAAQYLADLGVDLPALGAQPIRCGRFYDGENELAFDLPFTAWSLSRRRLDSALLEQAELAGAKVERGTSVRQLIRANEGWELATRRRSTPASGSGVVSARTVFLATGKHELRGWQRKVKVADDDKLIGLKMHFSPSASQQEHWRQAVEIHLFDGGYAGLEPIEDGGINLCFLISQKIYKTCGGSWPAVLEWLSCRSAHMAQRLADLTPLWTEPLAISGVPYGYIHDPDNAVPGLFRLGDQIAVIPSFAGDGIAIALHSALLAAESYAAGKGSLAYHQRAKTDLVRTVRSAKLLSDVFSVGVGRKAAFMAGRLWPRLPQEAILRTRVHQPDRG